MRRLGIFARSVLVGLVATAADLGALAVMIDGAGLPATVANVPALLLGVAVQYIGNKRFAFGDRSPVSARQICAFAIVEVGTFVLNAIAFHLLVTLAAASYLVARCGGTMAVYLTFSFPLWARVFRSRRPPSRPPAAVAIERHRSPLTPAGRS